MNRHRARIGWAIVAPITLCVLGVITPVTAGLADTASGGSPGNWLSEYASARSAGMGGAFVAAADEPLGAVWNPAGLSHMYQNTVSAETTRLFEDTSINGLSFAIPERKLPSIGFTVLALSSGEIERTSELNESLGNFDNDEFAFLLSTSKSLFRGLGVGANFKIVRQSIEEFAGTGFGADLGLVYELAPGITLGASLLNVIGPSLTLRETSETYPTEFRGGAALRALSGRALLTAEVDQRQDVGTGMRAGSEFWVHRSMALRVGYDDTIVSGGFSFIPSSGFRIDYGLSDHELGLTHRIGLSYRFGGFFASSEADPAVFSPIGEQSVTKFHLKAKTKAETQQWALEVTDKFNEVVRRYSGRGTPPAHLVWDGKDELGAPLPDGEYDYRLIVTDEEGREVVGAKRAVEIATGGPKGSVPAIVG
jgi:hypothetical protein